MPERDWKAGDLAWVARGPSRGVYHWRPVVVCGVTPTGRVSVEECLALGTSRGGVNPWMLRPRAEGEPIPPAPRPVPLLDRRREHRAGRGPDRAGGLPGRAGGGAGAAERYNGAMSEPIIGHFGGVYLKNASGLYEPLLGAVAAGLGKLFGAPIVPWEPISRPQRPSPPLVSTGALIPSLPMPEGAAPFVSRRLRPVTLTMPFAAEDVTITDPEAFAAVRAELERQAMEAFGVPPALLQGGPTTYSGSLASLGTSHAALLVTAGDLLSVWFPRSCMRIAVFDLRFYHTLIIFFHNVQNL